MQGEALENIQPHKPVLLHSFLETVAPVNGLWVDCTFGAGGYSKALCRAGAEHVIGIDRDPDVAQAGQEFEASEKEKFSFFGRRFSQFGQFIDFSRMPPLRGVVFDLGVSSMQLDIAKRGFSFKRDAPLDMRMEKKGISAADIVNRAPEATLAEIFFKLGEERASRRIARRITLRRSQAKISSTTELARIVAQSMPARRYQKVHPATRVFQALRIVVNNELEQLVKGLSAAERLLSEGGWLAVISFHSLEDRIVKRFIQGKTREFVDDHRQKNLRKFEPRFCPINRRPVQPTSGEINENPRSSSARMRIALRNGKPANDRIDLEFVGVPHIAGLERF